MIVLLFPPQLLSPSSLSGRQATPTSNAPITPQSALPWSTGRKRGRNTNDTPVHLKRRRVSVKQSADKQQGKGLRHFSQRVCEKVREKGNTTYNEVGCMYIICHYSCVILVTVWFNCVLTHEFGINTRVCFLSRWRMNWWRSSQSLNQPMALIW